MTRPKYLGLATLTRDLPEFRLRAGHVVTVVEVYAQGEAYEVEFMDKEGDTVALLTISAEDLRGAAKSALKSEPWPDPLPPGVASPVADAMRSSKRDD
jgi:uncharacterized protein DUF4926